LAKLGKANYVGFYGGIAPTPISSRGIDDDDDDDFFFFFENVCFVCRLLHFEELALQLQTRASKRFFESLNQMGRLSSSRR
jgi:hypothetical protein